MIISQLIGRNQQQDLQDQIQANQDVLSQGLLYDYMIQDPHAPLPLKAFAQKHGMGLLEEHGGKDLAENLPVIGKLMTGMALQSSMKGAQARQQQQAQAQDSQAKLADWTDLGWTTPPLPDRYPVGGASATPAGTTPPAGTNREYWGMEPGGASLQTLAGLPRQEEPPPGAALGVMRNVDVPGAPPAGAGPPSFRTLAGLPRQTPVPPGAAFRPNLPPEQLPGQQPRHRGFREKLADALMAFGGGMTGSYPPEYMADVQLRSQLRLQQAEVQQRMAQINEALVRGYLSPEQANEARRWVLTGEALRSTGAGATGPVGEAKDYLWAQNEKANPTTAQNTATADFILRKAEEGEQSRLALIKERELQTRELPNSTVAMLAEQYVRTGQMPTGGVRMWGRAGIAQIMAAIPEVAQAKGLSVGDMLKGWADVAAMRRTLNIMEPQYGQISTFEATAQKNLDRAITLGGEVASANAQFLNRPYREILTRFAQDPLLPAYKAAVNVAYTEVSRILNNPLGQGAVSDSARMEAQDVLNKDYTLEQLINVSNVLKADMRTRVTNMEGTIDAFRQGIATGKGPGQPGFGAGAGGGAGAAGAGGAGAGAGGAGAGAGGAGAGGAGAGAGAAAGGGAGAGGGTTGPVLPKPAFPGQSISVDIAEKYRRAYGSKEAAKKAAKADGWGGFN